MLQLCKSLIFVHELSLHGILALHEHNCLLKGQERFGRKPVDLACVAPKHNLGKQLLWNRYQIKFFR